MEVATHNEVMNELCSFHTMMNMSARERAIAEARERYLFEKRSMYSAGVNDGIKIGIDKGIGQGEDRRARQVATKMLKRNEPMADIIDYSGLPEEEILKIAKNIGLQ